MQNPDLNIEKRLWKKGLLLVAGVDEAGRGAWAGPVAAGAVILPADARIIAKLPGVRDSKQMTGRQRTYWAEKIKALAVCWAVGMADNEEIDQIGILPATRLAMKRAIDGLNEYPCHLLIDAIRLTDLDIPQTSMIKGDVKVLSIAAASVLAKTARDALLVSCESQYPGYGFGHHKGYGTRFHHDQLKLLGPCPIHRFSYAPIRELANLA